MRRSLTAQCLLALVLGLVVGVAVLRWQPAQTGALLSGADTVIRLWTNALRLIVAPLVITQLYVAIAGPRDETVSAGRAGALTPVVFAGLLVFTALVSIFLALGLVRFPWFQSIPLPNPAAPAPPVSAPGGLNWVDDLLPPNLTAAAAADALLALLGFTLAFALAARQLASGPKAALGTALAAVRDTLFVLIGWLLRLAPVMLFALTFRFASDYGVEIGRTLLLFIVLFSVALIVATAALYPLGVLAGRISPARLVRVLVPPQLTAFTTRSSLATVPGLLKAAGEIPTLEPGTSSLVIPLGGALLKLSRAVSGPVKLVFLASVLDLKLTPGQVVIFTVTILVLSVTTPGVPRVMSSSRSLPAYVAAGIPPEYVILLASTNAATDVFQTVLNTTGYFTADVLVQRLARKRVPVAKVATSAAATMPVDSAPTEALATGESLGRSTQ
jgi:Na+/H+-dicarboxylate symporter